MKLLTVRRSRFLRDLDAMQRHAQVTAALEAVAHVRSLGGLTQAGATTQGTPLAQSKARPRVGRVRQRTAA